MELNPTGRLARWRARCKVESRDLIELVLAPSLAAFLPWPLAFRVFQKLARWPFLYRVPVERALAQARQRGWVEDEVDWAWKRRLVTLIDHADLYLARTRSDRWMERHLVVQGVWPAPDLPAVLCTFHWGAGMWGLRHMGAAGIKVHALVAALHGEHFVGRSVLHWYARARTNEVSRALDRSTLDVSASMLPAIRALRRQEKVGAAVDAPADQLSANSRINLLDMPARVPHGLLRMAIGQKVPVCVYVTGVRMSDGKRFLRIHQLPLHDQTELLVQVVFGLLNACIAEDAPAWHFWGEADRVFLPPDAAPS